MVSLYICVGAFHNKFSIENFQAWQVFFKVRQRPRPNSHMVQEFNGLEDWKKHLHDVVTISQLENYIECKNRKFNSRISDVTLYSTVPGSTHIQVCRIHIRNED